MERIVFRAKSLATDEWVYGNYVHSLRFAGTPMEHLIIDQHTGAEYEVDGNTVCQFIGKYDSKGESIFENDILFNPTTKTFYKVFFDKAKYMLFSSFGIDENLDFENLLLAGNVFEVQELFNDK